MTKREMTSRERVLATFRGEPRDRIPLICPTSLANIECMSMAKAYYPYAHTNAAKMAALAATGFEVLEFDSVMPYFCIANEAAALGCTVDWGSKDRIPTVRASVLRRLDDWSPPTDYLSRQPVRTVIAAIEKLKARLGGEAAIIGKVVGPLSLLFYLYGIQNTLTSLVLEPALVRQVTVSIKELCVDFAQAQIEAGADIITISEDAAGDLISSECYRIVAMEAEQGLQRALERDAFTIFHLSCDIMDRLDLFAQTGFHALSFDSKNRLEEVVERIDKRMKLIGCVNTPLTLLNGDVDEVMGEVFASISAGMDFIAPECAVPCRTTNRNLLAMRRAVTLYQRRIG